MLKRTVAALFLGGGALLIALWESSGYPTHAQICDAPNGVEKCATYNILLAAALQLLKFLDDHGTLITAFATIAIAIFTLTLWRTTTEQGQLTREAIKLTRDEFNATHRPRLIVRGAYSVMSDPLDAPILVTYTIVNVGGTRAWIVQSFLDLELVTGPGLLLTPDSSKGTTPTYIGAIGPGESKELTFIAHGHVWDENHRRAWDQLEWGLHFIGHVVYIDEPGSNVRRQLAFRRRYDREGQRFYRIWKDDNAYEYAD